MQNTCPSIIIFKKHVRVVATDLEVFQVNFCVATPTDFWLPDGDCDCDCVTEERRPSWPERNSYCCRDAQRELQTFLLWSSVVVRGRDGSARWRVFWDDLMALLTLQLLSSSADKTMVPHFFPGIPLWNKERKGFMMQGRRKRTQTHLLQLGPSTRSSEQSWLPLSFADSNSDSFSDHISLRVFLLSLPTGEGEDWHVSISVAAEEERTSFASLKSWWKCTEMLYNSCRNQNFTFFPLHTRMTRSFGIFFYILFHYIFDLLSSVLYLSTMLQYIRLNGDMKSSYYNVIYENL